MGNVSWATLYISDPKSEIKTGLDARRKMNLNIFTMTVIRFFHWSMLEADGFIAVTCQKNMVQQDPGSRSVD